MVVNWQLYYNVDYFQYIWLSCIQIYLRKSAHVVTDLETSCNKVVVKPISACVRFAMLLPSCCDKSGTSCYHLVTRLMTLTDLL